jgi:RNA polymerase sigma-70 factor (ECF subfamily)
MLAPAEIEPTFHLPASPHSLAKPGRAKLTAAPPPEKSHFPLRPAGAHPATKRRGFDFDGIYRNYQRSIYSKCFRIVRNHTEAEDLVQEVFLQLLRKADTFRGEAKFSTWLHRLTINAALMQLRRLRRSELRTTSLEDAPGAAQDHAGAYKVALPRHASGALAADRLSLRVALSQLPPGYREVLSLHDVEGYTHAEIAQKLGISVGASKSQLHRARLRIRVLLQHGGKPAPGCSPRRSRKPPKATPLTPASRPAATASPRRPPQLSPQCDAA